MSDLSQGARDAATWPPECIPTPEQWLDWMLGLDREDQVAVAKRFDWAAETARACFVEDHLGTIVELRAVLRGRGTT